MKKTSDRTIYALLFALTVAVYSQVHNFAFLTFDDNSGLLGNPPVRDGLSWDGIVWAFTTAHASNWFPLTWLSHMLDFQLFGLDAGLHHLVNVLIHAVSAVFLLALLKRLTGRLWESAFVAFVFALHPLHVESVAWISERKDVLFAFFWFLTTWLYLDFLDQRTTRNYLLMVAAFCLGLMSKQTIVTLPFALLLLDTWPLKRTGWRTLTLEKVPLVGLSIAASVIAFFAQRKGGAVQSLSSAPLIARAANALMAYVLYLANFFWPVNLAFFYPYPPRWPTGDVLFAGILLAAISVAVSLAFRTRPYLAVGWFWYLGTLLPVIGLIQIGHQSRADRYTYIPLIGISIMLAWAAAEVIAKWPRAKQVVQGAAMVACAAWTLTTWVQIQYWKDSEALYRRAIAVTDANYLAHMNLGVDLVAAGRYQEGMRELYTSLEENQDLPHGRNSLGVALYMLGRKDEAIEQFEKSIQLLPTDAEPHSNLGNALMDLGKFDDAMREFSAALRIDPRMANAFYGVGCVLVKQNRGAEAVPYFNEALRIKPDFTEARQQLDALRGGR
jgi:tetratricopeptide (TPR) repeat protein